ncbi:MAG TPA: right-handed parallel beta-helix repeat-containing protein [Solirubrobacteraceae bacterium]|nr:right-handed parallel beta-helix repeat-containing protein [Solirubrobacteraceae bacterium]
MIGFRLLSARVRRLTLAAAICIVAVLAQSAVAGASTGRGDGFGDHGSARALYVSPSGIAGGADRSCASAGYSTIQAAVDAAPSGGTVIVCPGTYPENVTVSSPLTLVGRNATIEGTSTGNGSCGPLGPCLAGVTIRSSWVQIQGFTVTGAVGEGILAVTGLGSGSVSHVTITHNRVVGNDTGGIPPATGGGYVECEAQGGIPGDCGEGIHLIGVADSVVSRNYDSGNTGGVLLTDETGPTHGNLIENNVVTGNQYDCGITVPGHNPNALSPTGTTQPTVAGVFDNVIRNNVVTNNGLKGEGAGVLFADATAGTASYDNLVEHNYIAGNGLSGVTMHAHTIGPGQFEDLNGNDVVNNIIGRNNIDGDTLDGSQSDLQPTGVLVFSATVPVSVTIAHNVVFDNTYGIWEGVGGNVSATLAGNRFFGVGTPVFTQP